MSQKSITIKIQNIIMFHMRYHLITIPDMIYHIQKQYPEMPDDIIVDVILMMIDEHIIRDSVLIGGNILYSNSKNTNLLQKIWTFIMQMNYSSIYSEITNAFEMTDTEHIADAIGIMVAKNIVIKNGDILQISNVERNDILSNKKFNF